MNPGVEKVAFRGPDVGGQLVVRIGGGPLGASRWSWGGSARVFLEVARGACGEGGVGGIFHNRGGVGAGVAAVCSGGGMRRVRWGVVGGGGRVGGPGGVEASASSAGSYSQTGPPAGPPTFGWEGGGGGWRWAGVTPACKVRLVETRWIAEWSTDDMWRPDETGGVLGFGCRRFSDEDEGAGMVSEAVDGALGRGAGVRARRASRVRGWHPGGGGLDQLLRRRRRVDPVRRLQAVRPRP